MTTLKQESSVKHANLHNNR